MVGVDARAFRGRGSSADGTGLAIASRAGAGTRLVRRQPHPGLTTVRADRDHPVLDGVAVVELLNPSFSSTRSSSSGRPTMFGRETVSVPQPLNPTPPN